MTSAENSRDIGSSSRAPSTLSPNLFYIAPIAAMTPLAVRGSRSCPSSFATSLPPQMPRFGVRNFSVVFQAIPSSTIRSDSRKKYLQFLRPSSSLSGVMHSQPLVSVGEIAMTATEAACMQLADEASSTRCSGDSVSQLAYEMESCHAHRQGWTGCGRQYCRHGIGRRPLIQHSAQL